MIRKYSLSSVPPHPLGSQHASRDAHPWTLFFLRKSPKEIASAHGRQRANGCNQFSKPERKFSAFENRTSVLENRTPVLENRFSAREKILKILLQQNKVVGKVLEKALIVTLD
ncbi:MAG: hypothetical protein IKO20_08235 [Bacteroidaceae bacterium]|nr:hypothetical protein [Bacteroidaceae bacterium]